MEISYLHPKCVPVAIRSRNAKQERVRDAAQDMLAALEGVVVLWDEQTHNQPLGAPPLTHQQEQMAFKIGVARKAIAKAKGA